MEYVTEKVTKQLGHGHGINHEIGHNHWKQVTVTISDNVRYDYRLLCSSTYSNRHLSPLPTLDPVMRYLHLSTILSSVTCIIKTPHTYLQLSSS